MRKLKTFSLSQGHQLSCEEMTMLEGGDFISRFCDSVGQTCLIDSDDYTGAYTGTCQYVTVEGFKVLACVKN